ncbi:hypothetical protein BST97_03005 [Nonlabens spongiae]|uniref:Deoxyribose-phosphate aldolase n=1 Tax=Nonlabens spongiae TaxID=331648 RepID=A0A1W6MHH7_9FLAO|nr:DUF6503 family protein [Nonlabens spongiae]ARN77053.1 hypothetical protein BST97_03005 [Nonlabens spongiae]
MKKVSFLLLCLGLSITSCTEPQPDADELIAKTIKAHGADKMAQGKLAFNFRGIDYVVTRDNGLFTYERITIQNQDSVVDRLTNDGFKRTINDSVVTLQPEKKSTLSSSLNSVIYLGQLPFSLDGPAVYKKYLGETTINEIKYYEVEVTFDENGGGEDHEDVFIYWINQADFMIDYFAYSFCEEECGFRFRESYNRRNINGMIVQDYHNYSPIDSDAKLENLEEHFEQGKLEKVSDIELKRVSGD